MHPLHEALLEGDTYTFKTLLLTVNPSCIDRENGKSGLHYAAELGNFTYVDLLLDKKASLLKVDKKGHTILHSAAMGNLTDLTDILIKAGADVHAVDASRRQPMHYSVAITKSPYGDGMSVMGMHLAASADARLLWALGGYGREKGNFLAIGMKDVESALADGANPDAVDSLRNRRALHFAVEKGAPTAVALLLHRKAVVNRKDIDGRTALHTAARLENPGQDEELAIKMAKTLIHFGADVNAQDNDTMTPLHNAASLGATKLVSLLLAHQDANVHAVGGEKRRTALHFAASSENQEGALQTCRILLQKGSNVFGVDAGRKTALDLAIDRNAAAVVDLLLGSNLNSQLLWAVGGFGRKGLEQVAHKEVETLLEKGAVADTVDPVDGRAALHIGSAMGDKALVNLLLDKGADVNIRNDNKSTALHYAVENMDSDMTLLLLARGANIHLADRDSRTVLHITLEMGEVEMASTLLQMGADVNAVDSEGRTALHDTVLKGATEMVSTLLGQSADVLAIDSEFKNPLHYAVEKGFTEIIPLLLAPSRDAQLLWAVGGYGRPKPFEVLRTDVIPILREHAMGGEKLEGADANAIDPYTGCTALHYATSIGAVDVVELLLSKKRVVGETAEVNAMDRLGATPLHWAARSGDVSLECARKLTTLEGDVHAVDKAGNSPLYYAVEARAIGMVGLMLDKGADESSIEFEKLLKCSMTIRLLWTLGGYKPDGEDVESGAGNNRKPKPKPRCDAVEVATLLRDGANVMRIDSTTGRLALHYAAILNDTEVVRLIVDKDEHAIEVEDLDGKTALDLAFDLSHTGVSHELIAKGALNYHTFMDLEQVVAWRQHLIDDEMFVNALGRQIRFRTEGLPQDDASELFNLLDGVINSGLGTDLPALVRSEVVAPIVTNKEMVSYLKRKERMECLKKSCVEQLEFLQEQQDEIYAKDRLAQALGKLGNDLKLGEDPEKGGKAIVSRQDAKDLLPKTTGGGLNEAGYIHMLCMLALVLNEGYNDKLVHAIDSAVADSPEHSSVDDINIREAPPKSFERMSMLMESAHSQKKRPRPAHNLDVLRTSATFTTPQAMSHAFGGICKAFDVVRVKNMYAGRKKGQKVGQWDSAVKEAFGFRCIVVNFIYAPPGVTFGQLSKLHAKRGGAWFEYVLKLANIDAQMALSFMQKEDWKSAPVRLVCEVQLVYQPFLDIGKIKSHIYKKVMDVANSRDLSISFDPNASAKATRGGRAATPAAKQKKGGRIRAFTCGVCGRNNPGEGEVLPEQEGREDPDEGLADATEIQLELKDWVDDLQSGRCNMQEYVTETSLLKKKLVRAKRRMNTKAPGLCWICGAEKGRQLSNRKSLGQEIYDATVAGRTTTVKVLCEHATKAEANWSDGKHLDTALMAASAAGHYDIVQTLCNSGADQELRDKAQYTAKEIAALYGPLHLKPLNFTVNTRENAKKGH